MELLDKVFAHASLENGRLLSATCRLLNGIGRRYIFNSRRLLFQRPLGALRGIPAEREGALAFLETLAHSEKGDLLSAADFLLSRPDLTIKVKNISLSDRWRASEFPERETYDFDLLEIVSEFYTPIYKAFADVIVASSNLATVSLNSLYLTEEVVRGILQLRRLHTLDLNDCVIPSELEEMLVSEERRSPPSELFNLSLSVAIPTQNLWYILLLFPRLRTLAVFSIFDWDVPLPHPDMWARFDFFRTLERFVLDGIDFADVPLLVDWIRSATDGEGLCRLTHLRLKNHSAMDDREIYNLLDVIHVAPLKALILEGLSEAEFSLFDKIGELFGETLIALVLVRRASNRQRINAITTWPHPSWEYAPHLSQLTRLEHFGWNNRFENYIPTPSVLQRFEDDFHDADFYGYEEEEETYGRDRWSVLPFAAHCPNLQTFVNTEYPGDVCGVSRAPNGAALIKTLDMVWGSGGLDPFNVRKWSSICLEEGWPHILPEDVEMEGSGVGH